MNEFPFAPYLVFATFVAAIAVMLGGALIAVLSTRIIRSVSGLMVCCVGLAGLYFFLDSPFLALMKILIYVGAVCVAIVFAVMMAEPDEPAMREDQGSGLLWGVAAAGVALVVGGVLARFSLMGPWPEGPVVPVNDGSIAAVGASLLTTYSLAFETMAVLLLVAILGALVIARGGRTAPGHTTPDAAPPAGKGN